MKIVMFSTDGNGVLGDFSIRPGDCIMLMGSSPVHIWKKTEEVEAAGEHRRHPYIDCCNALGSPCPLQPMTGYSIPENAFIKGHYVIAKDRPELGGGTSNGQLNVGSGPGDPGYDR